MEHTHLVKGLDYALLNKVKAEIEEEERRARQLQEEQAKAAKASFGKQYGIYCNFFFRDSFSTNSLELLQRMDACRQSTLPQILRLISVEQSTKLSLSSLVRKPRSCFSLYVFA